MDRALLKRVRFPSPVVYSTSFCSHYVSLAVDKSLCKKPQMDTQLHHTSQSKQKLCESFSLLLLCFIFAKLDSVEYCMVSFTNDSEALWRKGFTMTNIILQSYINLWMSSIDGPRICVCYPVQ